MAQQSLTATLGSSDAIRAYACAAFAAVVIRYVASATQPTFSHGLFAVLAVAGIIAAYLLIARARLEPEATAANIIAASVLGGICFAITSYLV